MYDKDIVFELLNQIYNSTQIILDRFKKIKKTEDFLTSPNGMEKLDSICMQLIAMGESLKRLDKETNGIIFENYPDIDWRGAKGMRDIICHHYCSIDAETIFFVCKNKIGNLGKAIQSMIASL